MQFAGKGSGVVANKDRHVYRFSEGSAEMKDLLGGKGAGLAAMSNLGLPVPPGFTITSEACRAYLEADELPEGLMEAVAGRVRGLEEETGKRLGDPEDPLLVSVRSGAAVSMPGMMDTVLNLGLNDATVEASPAGPGTNASLATPTGASSRCSATSCSRWTRRASRRRWKTSRESAASRRIRSSPPPTSTSW